MPVNAFLGGFNKLTYCHRNWQAVGSLLSAACFHSESNGVSDAA